LSADDPDAIGEGDPPDHLRQVVVTIGKRLLWAAFFGFARGLMIA